MRKILIVVLGAGLLTAAALQVPALAAVDAFHRSKGGERGFIIEGGKNRQLGGPDTKNSSGSERGIVIEGGKTRHLGTPDTKK
jgi:hypothetical protein